MKGHSLNPKAKDLSESSNPGYGGIVPVWMSSPSLKSGGARSREAKRGEAPPDFGLLRPS